MTAQRRKVNHSSMLASDPANHRVNVNEEMDNVEVRWMFRPDPLGKHEATVQVQPGIYRQVRGQYTYSVLVRSEKFKHSKMVGEIAPEDVTNLQKTRRHLGILAGALCEELNLRFDDNLDPSEVARAAIAAFQEMVDEQKAALLQNTA